MKNKIKFSEEDIKLSEEIKESSTPYATGCALCSGEENLKKLRDRYICQECIDYVKPKH